VAKLTEADWGKIHAKAWKEPKFRRLLETDPARAIRTYYRQAYKRSLPKGTKIMTIRNRPTRVPDEHLHKVHTFVPWCC
jgi:hypothetical protein